MTLSIICITFPCNKSSTHYEHFPMCLGNYCDMKTISKDSTTKAVEFLCNNENEYTADVFETETGDIYPSSYEDCVSTYPIFDTLFIPDGNETIHLMTNFSSYEFHAVWEKLRRKITAIGIWIEDQNFMISSADAFFMTLSVLKHGDALELLANTFRIKAPVFERYITCFLEKSEPPFFNHCVTLVDKDNPIRTLIEGNKTFKHHPQSRYATDDTFHQQTDQWAICKSRKNTLVVSKRYMGTKTKFLLSHQV